MCSYISTSIAIQYESTNIDVVLVLYQECISESLLIQYYIDYGAAMQLVHVALQYNSPYTGTCAVPYSKYRCKYCIWYRYSIWYTSKVTIYNLLVELTCDKAYRTCAVVHSTESIEYL